ncbi:MAG: hypothetical protein AAB402_00450 [Patescibacteria group bacterium]
MNSIHNHRQTPSNWLFGAVLVCSIALIATIFGLSLKAGTPPGGDSSVYILDARFILNHGGRLPTDNNNAYVRRPMYESPVNSLLLVVLNRLTGLDIEYPLFSTLQMILVMEMLVLLGIVIGRSTGSQAIQVVGTVLGLNFYGLFFLFNSSTIANFLGFINILLVALTFYCLPIRPRSWSVLVIVLVSLYFTHRSLSFIYFVVAMMIIVGLRASSWWSLLKPINKKIMLLIGVLVAGALMKLVPIVRSMIIYNYHNSDAISGDRFAQKIVFEQYITNLREINIVLFLFAFVYLLRTMKKRSSTRILSPAVVWTLVGISLTLLAYLGIYFYYGRFLYMVWPGLIIVVVIGLHYILCTTRMSKFLRPLIVCIILSQAVIYAVQTNSYVAAHTNFVGPDQVAALKFIKDNSTVGSIVLGNISEIAPFDVSISNRLFIHQDISRGVLTDANWLADNDISMLFITIGDIDGKKFSELSRLVKATNRFTLEYANQSAEVYRPLSRPRSP